MNNPRAVGFAYHNKHRCGEVILTYPEYGPSVPLERQVTWPTNPRDRWI